MHLLAIFCKTCMRDVENLKLLLESIKNFNRDDLPICLSIAREEREDLEPIIKNFGLNTTIFFDDEICPYRYENSDKFMQGWISQQYVKLNLYKTNFAKHYIIMDSDSYFIKDFYKKDFLYNEDIPYLPVTDHTKAERIFLSLFYKFKPVTKENPMDKVFGICRQSITLDNPWVLTSDYIKQFEEYLETKGLDFPKIIALYYCEMDWYLRWVLYKNFPFQPTSAFFIPFHVETQYQIFRWLGYDEEIFKQNYLGVLMNKGHVKSIKYKPCWIGQNIIRKIIKYNYSKTAGRNDYCQQCQPSLLENIFSVKESTKLDCKRRVIKILGIKFSFKL